MSTTAPWLALSCDWDESEMFDDATDGHRLAWVYLLCHVKKCGRAGRAKLRALTFARCYQISERSVSEMLKSARDHGAITIDGDIVSVVNWRSYQDKFSKSRKSETPPFSETWENSTTKDPVPSTHHPPPTTQNAEKARAQNPRQKSASKPKPFDAFWKIVHHKVGKEAARKAFAAAVKRGAKPEFLIERMTAFAKTPSANPSERTPIHPSTWLNQGRYEDDPKTWERTDGRRKQSPARIKAEPGKYDNVPTLKSSV